MLEYIQKIYLNEVFYDSKDCYFNNPVFWDSRRLTYYPNVIFAKEKAERTSLTSI